MPHFIHEEIHHFLKIAEVPGIEYFTYSHDLTSLELNQLNGQVSESEKHSGLLSRKGKLHKGR